MKSLVQIISDFKKYAFEEILQADLDSYFDQVKASLRMYNSVNIESIKKRLLDYIRNDRIVDTLESFKGYNIVYDRKNPSYSVMFSEDEKTEIAKFKTSEGLFSIVLGFNDGTIYIEHSNPKKIEWMILCFMRFMLCLTQKKFIEF